MLSKLQQLRQNAGNDDRYARFISIYLCMNQHNKDGSDMIEFIDFFRIAFSMQ